MSVLLLVLVSALGAFAGCWVDQRFRKPKAEPTTPNHARLIARPGATLDLVTDDGVIAVKVVLSSITYDLHHGTEVLFEDYFKRLERNTYRG